MDRRSQLKKGSALPVLSASSDRRVCVTKSKTRERRFRSLQDIYMNSPRCTLEDVEKLSKMTEQDIYMNSPRCTHDRLNGKSGELGPSKKRKYKSKKISDSVVGKKLPSESGEAVRSENHHVEVISSKRNSTSKEKQPQSTSSIKGKEKMCSSTGSSIRAVDKQQPVPLEIIGQMTNPDPTPDPSSQIPNIAVRTEGPPFGKTCLPSSCIAADSPMSGKSINKYSNSAVISSIPDQESQSIVVVTGQCSVVPTNSINATGQHATEFTRPSSSSTGARKLRLFGFNIDPTATQTCQVTNIDNGLHNNQIDFMSINGGHDAGGHLPHQTIIAAQPNMINEFGDNRCLSVAASPPVPWAISCYLPLVAAPTTNINDTVGYYNYPLPAAAAAVLNHRVFMNGLSGFVPPGVAPGNINIIFQCLPAQSFTSHQLGSFNSQAVTINPTPAWNSGVPAASSCSRPIRPTPRRFLPPPSSA